MVRAIIKYLRIIAWMWELLNLPETKKEKHSILTTKEYKSPKLWAFVNVAPLSLI